MIAESAVTGDRLATLRALRDRLAVDIDECESARDVAALSQRLMDVLAQIADLSAGVEKETTKLDEFTKRLAERAATRAAGA